jgi:hypothetical protein
LAALTNAGAMFGTLYRSERDNDDQP